ncbi:MAG: ribonuclease P protein component [Candidatus Hydrothermae bacterium]|nr:ribonuclease P protein component [Candidatus Hydrothermae bacterium]
MRKGGNVSPTEARHTFPRAERLRSSAAFQEVIQQGRWVSTPTVIVYHLPHEERRVGVAAVRRLPHRPAKNRVRRRLRELYRLHKSWFPPGWYVLIGRERAKDCPWDDLVRDLRTALQRLFPPSSSD